LWPSKYAKIRFFFGRGSAGPRWESSRCSPRRSSRLEKGHPSDTHPSWQRPTFCVRHASLRIPARSTPMGGADMDIDHRGTSPPEFGVMGTLMQIVSSDFVIQVQKGAFCGLQNIRHNPFSAVGRGSPTSLGSSRRSNIPLVGLGGGTPPHTPPHSAPTHLRRSPWVPKNSSQIYGREKGFEAPKAPSRGGKWEGRPHGVWRSIESYPRKVWTSVLSQRHRMTLEVFVVNFK